MCTNITEVLKHYYKTTRVQTNQELVCLLVHWRTLVEHLEIERDYVGTIQANHYREHIRRVEGWLEARRKSKIPIKLGMFV